jgi:hypothetical protein
VDGQSLKAPAGDSGIIFAGCGAGWLRGTVFPASAPRGDPEGLWQGHADTRYSHGRGSHCTAQGGVRGGSVQRASDRVTGLQFNGSASISAGSTSLGSMTRGFSVQTRILAAGVNGLTNSSRPVSVSSFG